MFVGSYRDWWRIHLIWKCMYTCKSPKYIVRRSPPFESYPGSIPWAFPVLPPIIPLCSASVQPAIPGCDFSVPLKSLPPWLKWSEMRGFCLARTVVRTIATHSFPTLFSFRFTLHIQAESKIRAIGASLSKIRAVLPVLPMMTPCIGCPFKLSGVHWHKATPLVYCTFGQGFLGGWSGIHVADPDHVLLIWVSRILRYIGISQSIFVWLHHLLIFCHCEGVKITKLTPYALLLWRVSGIKFCFHKPGLDS